VTVKILKKDEVHMKVLCDMSTAQEISDHFTFEVPGAKFTPLYRNKMWDGKLRLFSLVTKELYLGLLPYLIQYCEVNNIDLDISEFPSKTNRVTFEQVSEFCDNLNLGSNGNPLLIRDYQVEAVYRAICDERRLLLSPTGSGKSLIIYCLLRWYEQFNSKQLILVPTTSLVEQMYSDFKDYSCLNGWDVETNCHRIYSGHEKITDLPIIISTWQSVYELPKKWFEVFDVVVGDESHTFKAKSLTSIMTKLNKAKYRVGTTGTLDGTKTHRLVLEGMFGTVYNVTTTRELIDKNQLADIKIFCLILSYNPDIRKQNSKLKYQEEIDFLVQHEPRNKFIRNLALSQTGNTLVLFQFVEKHGKVLFDLICKKDENRKVFFVSGQTETESREQIRKIIEKENNAIIVASYGTYSTGINIKNLHNIIFASSGKSRIRNLQSIGRGLRKGDQKEQCNLYDIGDDMEWKSRKNYTLLHMIERIKIYNDEQFDYNTVKVDI
jgi:superfamily II DNA or RNA helicase